MSAVTHDQLVKMDIDELRKLNEDVIDVIKWKRSLIAKEMGNKISIGNRIKIDNKNYLGRVFIVQKINKKNLVGKEEGTNTEYNIPMDVVEKI